MIPFILSVSVAIKQSVLFVWERTIQTFVGIVKYTATIQTIEECACEMYQFIKAMNQIGPVESEEVFRLFPHLPTTSGLWMSIQCSQFHYCYPRETLKDLKQYQAFEVALFGKSKRKIQNQLASFSRIEELGDLSGELVFPYVSKDLVEALYRYLNPSA